MRIVSFLASAIFTVALVVLLNSRLPVGGAKTPAFGAFLSPQHGFWQNAEASNTDFNATFHFPQLQGTAEVYLDDRLVPHVYAQNENDLYFVQGYLHAKFRLWQMEFQTHAAAGRLSEIMGDSSSGTSFLKIDKFFRRLGMVYGAEQSLKKVQEDPIIKAETDAYTKGVNAYISSLKPNQYPFEYKLLNYKPEPWTNLKTQLFLMYMSFDLTGHDIDFELTAAKRIFSMADIEALSPVTHDSLDPIIPRGTKFPRPSVMPKMPADANAYFSAVDSGAIAYVVQPDEDNGSNNWAVTGSKTQSGAPILCNDPHLGLNLPSLWYEMQLSTPEFSCYGVSFPGAPSIIIGFNEHIAWGVTNAGRDVKDYYEITFRDSTMKEYLYNGSWRQTSFRKEVIKIRGGTEVTENIAMTVFGPVMYDNVYKSKLNDGKYYAVRWAAHDPGNALLTFNRLDRAANYAQFESAISTFDCPGQNFVFASKSGDIAIQQQGKFPAKWRRQGSFVMPGKSSEYAWQGYIPAEENPRDYNPARGFVSSANQLAADSTYPYYLSGPADIFRGISINRKLNSMSHISVEDMQALQNDNYNVFAEMIRPVLVRNIDTTKLDADELSYFSRYRNWSLHNDIAAEGATIFDLWWTMLDSCIYHDEYARSAVTLPFPAKATTMQWLLKGGDYKFVDNITTPKKETLGEIVLRAFKAAYPDMVKLDNENHLAWGKYKDTHIQHLLKLPACSRLHLPIGGGEGIINATKAAHGPSWRMVVQMSSNIEAFGVYPGGQSGNPGSPYYDTFVDNWVNGTYYPLHLWKQNDAKTSDEVLWVMTFSK